LAACAAENLSGVVGGEQTQIAQAGSPLLCSRSFAGSTRSSAEAEMPLDQYTEPATSSSRASYRPGARSVAAESQCGCGALPMRGVRSGRWSRRALLLVSEGLSLYPVRPARQIANWPVGWRGGRILPVLTFRRTDYHRCQLARGRQDRLAGRTFQADCFGGESPAWPARWGCLRATSVLLPVIDGAAGLSVVVMVACCGCGFTHGPADELRTWHTRPRVCYWWCA